MGETGVFQRGGHLVRSGGRLGQMVGRRPPGVTTRQWNTASGTSVDFAVYDERTGAPVLAVLFGQPAESTDAGPDGRMTRAVCDAVGLAMMRIGSTTLDAARQGRRIVDYVLDAYAFTEASAGLRDTDDPLAERPPGFREIVGRLPDGRSGFVNDLGALARVAAIEAYTSRKLADPLLRGLHVSWRGAAAEGWGWLDLPGGRCLFERVTVWQHRFFCGVDSGQLAEDLAALAVGERLRDLDTAPGRLLDKDALRRDLDLIRSRRAELDEPRATDHICI